MALTNLGRRFLARAEAEIRKMEQDLGNGTAQDFSEYRFQAGIIKGINLAIQLMEDSERD